MRVDQIQKVQLFGKEFIRVASLSELKESTPILLKLDYGRNIQIVIVKSNGKVYAVSNICPHQHRPSLHNGIVKGNCISCPEHGWTFDLVTGENIDKSVGMQRLEIYETLVLDNVVYIYFEPNRFLKWNFNFE